MYKVKLLYKGHLQFELEKKNIYSYMYNIYVCVIYLIYINYILHNIYDIF